MYVNDFDNNGQIEAVLTYFVDHKEITFASKDELQKQLPIIKKKFLYAETFANANLQDILGQEKLSAAKKYTTDYFSNSIFINDGKNNFKTVALPWQAQITPYKDALPIDINSDGLMDILCVGNFYNNNIQMGRFDADYGTILINKGNYIFEPSPINGLFLQGQIRLIKPIIIKGKKAYILGKNNGDIQVIK